MGRVELIIGSIVGLIAIVGAAYKVVGWARSKREPRLTALHDDILVKMSETDRPALINQHTTALRHLIIGGKEFIDEKDDLYRLQCLEAIEDLLDREYIDEVESDVFRLTAKGLERNAQRISTLTQEEYIEERKLLYRHQQSNYENYEKTILTLGSALLAFSVAYLRLLPAKVDIVANPLLIASWIGFGVAIVSILLSFLVSGIAFNAGIKAIEEARSDGLILRKRNRWSPLVYFLYGSGGLAFITGIVSIIVFSVKNLDNL